jgi:hypothetical protein
MFLPTSRYHALPTASLIDVEGREIAYVRRRFVPSTGGDGIEHTVTQGDRIDNVTARTLGDPELYWRLCDANGARRPTELTDTVGRKLRVPFFTSSR